VEEFEAKGKQAFPLFRDRNGDWFSEDRYLFVYDMDGINIFHPVNPEFEGRNLLDMEDMDGKPVIKYMIEAVDDEKEPWGWVHYSWLEPGTFFPLWKSSFVMKAVDPDGKEYLIGSGIYNMRQEKAFLIDTVDDAVELIEKEGAKAFEAFKKKSGQFRYMDVSIFVISMDGKAVVDPAFPSQSGRDLLDLKDSLGKYIVKDIIEKLKTKDTAWVIYMWPQPGEVKPSRKAAYVRKVKIVDKYYIVGSAIFLANPIWLKL
jgi:signal transduction histidine kinase